MNLPVSDQILSSSQKASLFTDPADEQRNHTIRKTILEAGNRLREQYPWLVSHQDRIGMGLLATA